jgi:hypothetical protein
MTDAGGYDKALADAVGDSDDLADLRVRLLSGGASGVDRRTARDSLSDDARQRFDLAHPSPPSESAQGLDGGELKLERADVEDAKAFKDAAEKIRERLAEALAEGEPVESLVRLRIRVSNPDGD